MSDYTSYCSDCGCITDSISDHATGDLICSDCGLVLESHSIDDSREWRTFSNSDSTSDTHDPNRVGESNSTFLLDSHLTTFTSTPNSTTTTTTTSVKPDSVLDVGPTVYRMMNREVGQGNKALGTISHMCDQLGLISSIQHLAQHLYSTLHPQAPSSFRGKHHHAFLGACVYVACTQEGLPRTVKEISLVANGASKKDILRAKTFITKHHHLPGYDLRRDEEDNGVAGSHEKVVRASDLVKRFCSNVGMMNHRVMKAAQEAVDKLEGGTDVRRSPVSVAAAIVYVIRQLWDDYNNVDDNNNSNKMMKKKKKVDMEEIANATGVGKNTIMKTYMDMYPHLWKIVPTWFAQPHQISRLYCPTRLE